MRLVYIAGPFRAPTYWGILNNIKAAEAVGLQVARAGHSPVIPHSNTGSFHGEGEDQFWLEATMALLRRCDAVVCTNDWMDSSGARAEVAEAKRLRIPWAIIQEGWEEVDGQPAGVVKVLDDPANGVIGGAFPLKDWLSTPDFPMEPVMDKREQEAARREKIRANLRALIEEEIPPEGVLHVLFRAPPPTK